MQVAAAAGIVESDVRRALVELFFDRTFEPDTLAWKLYGKSRLKAVREVEARRGYLDTPGGFPQAQAGPQATPQDRSEFSLGRGRPRGTVRRALDFSAITPCSRCDLWSSGSRTWATGEVVSASSPTSRTSVGSSLVGQHPRRHACPSSGDSRGLRLALLPRGRTGLRRAQPRFQARLQKLAPTCARPWTPCWTQPKKSPPEKSRPSSPRAESWSDPSLEPIPKFTAQEEEE